MRTYRLGASSVTASANGISSIQIIRNGRIKGVCFAATFSTTSDGGGGYLELSTMPLEEEGDTLSEPHSVCGIRAVFSLVTSGAAQNSVNQFYAVDKPIGQGESLYLNFLEDGAVTGNFDVWVYVQEGK